MSFSALAIKIGCRVKAYAIFVFSDKSQGIKRFFDKIKRTPEYQKLSLNSAKFCLAQSCQEKTVVVG